MKSKTQLLATLKKIREKNNAEWMRLVSLALDCDKIKREVYAIMKNITKNDEQIQDAMKLLTQHEGPTPLRPRRS
jgi:hypothetical protein